MEGMKSTVNEKMKKGEMMKIKTKATMEEGESVRENVSVKVVQVNVSL